MITISEAHKSDHQTLLEIWESSVRSTHHFLKDENILFYKSFVKEAFSSLDALMIAKIDNYIAGFAGVSGNKIEMLFIHPEYMNAGAGKKLLLHAINELKTTMVDVNEQNEKAIDFYHHMGFKTIGRSDYDFTGNSFPLLHMEYHL